LFLKEKNKTTLVFYFQIADKIFYLNKKNCRFCYMITKL